MDLRKLTMVVFLNDGDGLDEVRKSSEAKMGALRLYTKGTNATDGVVDIIPRMGRAVLFKSEHMLHKVNPTFGYDNWQVTTYFTQVVNKPPIDHPIPSDWKIFIGVAAYRDLQLVNTLKSMVRLAKHPERLRIVILNQYNFTDEWDLNLLKGVKEFIAEAEAYEKPPTFVMEEVPHEEAKNCYHARYRLQKHYNDETYQL